MMSQLKKTEETIDQDVTWEKVSFARQDDLLAEIGRYSGDDVRDHRVRISRRGERNPEFTLEVKSWELPKLAGLVQWTADAVSLLPTIRQMEADDMSCLAACLTETLGRISMRSVLRLDLDGQVTEAMRAIIEEMLDQEARNFADDPCTEHIYRRVLLVNRWLAGYSTAMLDEVPEDVDPGDFGVCPLCFEWDVRLNIHRSHWLICHKHRVCWCPGENLFSDWRQESESDWQRNVTKLKEYLMVEPFLSVAMAV